MVFSRRGGGITLVLRRFDEESASFCRDSNQYNSYIATATDNISHSAHETSPMSRVSKVVVKKNISFDDYKNCVLKNEPKNVKVNAIRTVKMMNYSLTQNKLALSNKDDKRVWKNTNSTAWGHWRNLGSAPNEQ